MLLPEAMPPYACPLPLQLLTWYRLVLRRFMDSCTAFAEKSLALCLFLDCMVNLMLSGNMVCVSLIPDVRFVAFPFFATSQSVDRV